MRKIVSCVFLVFLGVQLFAQADVGDDLFDNLEFRQAINFYKNAPNLTDEQQAKYAFALLQVHNYSEAEKIYEKVVKIEDIDPIHFYYYAICLKNNKKYDLAKGYFELSKAFNPTDYFSDLNLRSMDSLPVFDLNNLPLVTNSVKEINSPIAEFSPQPYKDGVLFCKEIKYDKSKKRPQIDFSTDYNDTSGLDYGTAERPLTALYYSNFHEGEFDTPKLIALSEKFHIGSFAIHPKTNEIYFTKTDLISNWSPDAKYFPRLFKATLNEDNKKLENVEKVKISHLSPNVGTGHPAFSDDGSKLYFAAELPGGYGGSDLYVCNQDDKGTWEEPINLGSKINTYGDELFPRIQNNKLYFSSNGKIGYGDLDLFEAILTNDTNAVAVRLIGKPINSPADDFGLLYFGDNRQTGIVVSNRFGGVGDDDLFYFEPLVVETKVAGIIYDENGIPAANVLVTLYDEKGNEIAKTSSDENGEYEITNLEKNKSYTIVATKKGLGDKQTFFTDDNWSNEKDLTLKPSATAQGIVKNEDGSMAPNTKIQLLDEDNNVIFEGITDENGFYQFLLDSNKTYTIIAQKDNLSGKEKITTNTEYDSFKDKDIILKSSDTFVEGIVKDDGNPKSGINIELYDDGGNLVSQTTTDENGKFHFDLDRDKSYQIEASDSNFEGNENIFTGLNWDSDKEIEITLKPKGTPGKGIVKDRETNQPIPKVKVTLTDDSTGKKKIVYTDQDGLFNLRFNPQIDYTLSLEKEGYFPKTITIKKSDKLPKEIDLNLEKDLTLTHSGFNAKEVYFGFDKYQLTTEAKEYLNQIIIKLKSNPKLVVHIKSFTDCIGGKTYNQSLSWKRSRAVKQYLIKNGIAENRILTKSMGATNFVNNCYQPNMCSEAEHALNRRSEIEVKYP